MRVCLQCGSEFIDAPEKCRSCGADTVTEAHAKLQRELRDRIATEDLIEIHEFDGPVDEAIIRRLLDDAEIPFAVKGGSQGGHLPGIDHGGAHGWGHLLVLEEHVDDARRVVRHYANSVVPELTDADVGIE